MTRYLLDVNVLVALVDGGHVHHRAAQEWFVLEGATAWATCPITETGLTRILSNPKYSSQTLSVSDAASVLRRLKDRLAATYEFWPDSLSIQNENFHLHHLTGAKQITDMYLLGLATKHSGSLATFDGRMDARMIHKPSASLITLLQASCGSSGSPHAGGDALHGKAE